MRGVRALAGVVLLVGAPCARAAPLLAQSPDSAAPLSLEAALDTARAHNAGLPVARMAVQAAVARARQARGALFPTLSVDGDVHSGVPQAYASSDAFIRVLGETPIYQGGELRANLIQAGEEASALGYGYRSSVRDVERSVRGAYGRVLRAQDALAFLRRGEERLQAYLRVVESRRAAGQGVGADLLRTRQRLAAARGDIAAAERELENARLQLNDVLGRAPTAPLALAPLPEPAAPPDTAGAPWLTVPDVAEAMSRIRAAAAGVRSARAGRRPHLSLQADVGAQPFVGSDVALMNNGRGGGAEVMLSFSLPFWDMGIYRGRVAEASANLEQARAEAEVTRRFARLSWAQAEADVAGLFREYQARTESAAAAQDAYLQAESLYRGGQGTALDVLDAYDAWVQAERSRLDAVYGYRLAQADLIRWGTP